MPTPIQLLVGPQVSGDGSQPILRGGKSGEGIVSELHGRFYESNYRSAVFSGGMTLTAINAATFTSATLGATCTPIAGVWNPVASPVNLVVLQAILSVTLTALQNTGGAPYVWAVSYGNAALTLGTQPFNRKTLQQTGSQAKNLAGVALTGLTNNLVVMGSAPVGGGNAYNIASLGTAAGFSTTHMAALDTIDGSIIVPPGGVIALLATTTPVAHSVASSLVWEEVLV